MEQNWSVIYDGVVKLSGMLYVADKNVSQLPSLIRFGRKNSPYPAAVRHKVPVNPDKLSPAVYIPFFPPPRGPG